MKYSPAQYARIFSSFLEKTPKSRRKKAVKQFVEMMNENGDLKNESEIVYAIEKVLYEESKSLKVEVAEAKNHNLNMPKKIGHKQTFIKKEVDGSLIGGVKIKIGDMIIDNSIQSRIKNLKEAVK